MSTGKKNIRIAIDTGGTFTDIALLESTSGRMVFHKVASTPDDPGRSLVQGILEIIELAQIDGDDGVGQIELLVHGTTVATNAVLQRRGAKAAFITTQGFRDVLHIQRQDRPHMYDLRSRRAEPLVPRSRRFELKERILHDGSVEIPLDQEHLHQVIAELKQHNVEAVAVGLLHSHTAPEHEQAVGETLAKELPEATVCMSHELVQEEGEYERFSTCAMNAFVQPVMARYLGHVEGSLSEAGLDAPLFVMKSNGGVMSAKAAARHSVHTILSGPAGGVVAGAAMAAGDNHMNLITADMGGTSFDVAVIHEGQIEFARTTEMAGLAIKVPMLDIHTVGAGGGSIGWVDPGGALRVGPASAGADPGPACYGRGGDQPTVTDANLVLGRLSHGTLLGGGMEVDVEASKRVITDKLAGPLGLSVEAAAEGMIRVVVATMTAAIRKLTVERGYDPRTFTLCPFGGAGPLHGAEIAREMNVDQVLVPLAPGVTSAVGLLMSQLREDSVRTQIELLSQSSPDQILSVMDELENAARMRLAFAAADYGLRTTIQLGMRYLGQGFDIAVEVPAGKPDLVAVAAAFHAAHERMYGFSREDQPVELVSIWVSVEVDLGVANLPEVNAAGKTAEPESRRKVVYDGQYIDTPVFRRDDLGAGNTIEGPAIVEQLDSTTVLWPGQTGTVDQHGQLLLGAVS